MKINFYKYQGAGNDFVIIDNRDNNIQLSTAQINFLCDRRFGIGADGLMLLENADGFDYKMLYYNADGNESTMCGNGGRCIAAFAKKIEAAQAEQHFIAIDGPHLATIIEADTVALQMKNINHIEIDKEASILDTGSPHFVKFVTKLDGIDVVTAGRDIRNRERFQPKGINVNFVEVVDDKIKVRTYERGVEDETLACGTGVTAAAIAAACNKTGIIETDVEAMGGDLKVRFNKINSNQIEDIWLTGSAKLVFEGEIEI